MKKILIFILIGLLIYLVVNKCVETFSDMSTTIQFEDYELNDMYNQINLVAKDKYLEGEKYLTLEKRNKIIDTYKQSLKTPSPKKFFDQIIEEEQIFNDPNFSSDYISTIYLELDFDDLFGGDQQLSLTRKLVENKIISELKIENFLNSTQNKFNNKIPELLIKELLKTYDPNNPNKFMNLKDLNDKITKTPSILS